eukprot:CAMPEP_0172875222 /NCGR_PEP_ID=MMETSP1075-20121228/100839_1 /TAXON_ID=2916 /ORGANISM="Ceratium fusus, Strain PA161109" /LENGTH=45 /DNA_ID= /DNA_START= /DNA_END= /DNA_ORIENTATION=
MSPGAQFSNSFKRPPMPRTITLDSRSFPPVRIANVAPSWDLTLDW